jgi:putative transposase
VIEKLRASRLTRAAELAEAGVEETLTYYGLPEEHWRRIRTNNPLERILREIRRRTRVVGAFPDRHSALNLAAARLRNIAGTAWSTKRYLNIELLKDQQMRGAITAWAPEWDCRSADPSRIAWRSFCGPPTTLRMAQVFISFYLAQLRQMK